MVHLRHKPFEVCQCFRFVSFLDPIRLFCCFVPVSASVLPRAESLCADHQTFGPSSFRFLWNSHLQAAHENTMETLSLLFLIFVGTALSGAFRSAPRCAAAFAARCMMSSCSLANTLVASGHVWCCHVRALLLPLLPSG